MLLFPESGPKTNVRVNGFAKTVTTHLRSIVHNVQPHMAYFGVLSVFLEYTSLSPPRRWRGSRLC